MTQFEHIAVLISIIIGVGITQLLTNVYQLIQVRERVKPFWLPIMWTCVIFVAMVEWWWYLFEIRDKISEWNFFYLLFVLMSPVTLFMAAAFVLPEPKDDEIVDLRVYYFRSHAFFFSMLAAGPILDSIRRAGETGSFLDFGSISNAVSAVLLGTLAVSKNVKYHAVITIVVTALFTFFIGSSALQLK